MARGLTKAVIPVAGPGIRFLPATRAVPKELLPVVDVPVVHLAVQEAAAAGFKEIILVTCRGKSTVEDYFDLASDETARRADGSFDPSLVELANLVAHVRFSTVRQHAPLGLGHAVLTARSLVGDEPFAVLLPDDVIDSSRPTIGDLVKVYDMTGSCAVSLVEVPSGDEPHYGMIAGAPIEGIDVFGRQVYRISDTVEKPPVGGAPSRMAIVGRYVLTAEVFDVLESTPAERGGEIRLTDALGVLAGRRPSGLVGLSLSGDRYDTGDRFGYLMANVAFALKRPALRRRVREQLLALLQRPTS
jgi:UTP--glucose-1-phosphate uridylyltransferase